MRAVEFTIELGNKPVVTIPREVADKLPKSGRARIIVLMPDDPEDALWRAGAYEQFVREESPEDAVVAASLCRGEGRFVMGRDEHQVAGL